MTLKRTVKILRKLKDWRYGDGEYKGIIASLPYYHELGKVFDYAIKILEKPLRNCDVGTADEQIERHLAYCNDPEMMCGSSGSLACRKCFAKWTQMPYEGEVKK